VPLKKFLPLAVILFVLITDQALKFWVKTNMYLGEEFSIAGNWFIIHFTENNGMAFGFEFAGENGKLFLSIFRILAVGGIGWYLFTLVRDNFHTGLIISISFILAGALGNIIDSAFYGILFEESDEFTRNVAAFMPQTGGYSTFLHGKVVDMLYFPLVDSHFPQWFPIWGGERFIFFRPVFNIADSSITAGVILIILFQSRFYKKENSTVQEAESIN
jgi:signal peptidase II